LLPLVEIGLTVLPKTEGLKPPQPPSCDGPVGTRYVLLSSNRRQVVTEGNNMGVPTKHTVNIWGHTKISPKSFIYKTHAPAKKKHFSKDLQAVKFTY
jgi:hypothetical protein